MELKDWLTLLVGSIGATLGVVNFARSIVQERVNLTVIPKISFNQGDGYFSLSNSLNLERYLQRFDAPELGVEVINLSRFPVVIDEIGICESSVQAHRAPFLHPTILRKKSIPLKLEPRESALFISRGNHLTEYSFTRRTCAYAKTACGQIKFGTSDALKGWIKAISPTKKKA